MWDISVSVAQKMNQENYEKSDLDDMDKFEMAQKFDERIKDFPDIESMYDGKEYEEDDCYDYFKVLVGFQLALLKNPNRK